jgi:putative transcriptional regulator
MAKRDTKFGKELIASLKEALAHARGEIALPTRIVEPMTPARVKAIRKARAKSTREFEAKYGLPARTVEGWEQGKQMDVASRILLKVIEKEPKAVEKALAKR